MITAWRTFMIVGDPNGTAITTTRTMVIIQEVAIVAEEAEEAMVVGDPIMTLIFKQNDLTLPKIIVYVMACGRYS